MAQGHVATVQLPYPTVCPRLYEPLILGNAGISVSVFHFCMRVIRVCMHACGMCIY